MNRIYRRIWSATRQCWVVASELSSPRGKPSRSKGSRAATLLLPAALLCTSASAVAEVARECASDDQNCQANNEPVSWQVESARSFLPAMSARSMGILGSEDTMYGSYSSSSGNRNAIFGRSAKATFDGIAVGYYAEAGQTNAVAVGANARAAGLGGIAVGRAALAANNAEDAIAIGRDSSAGTAYTPGAIAVGKSARASYESVALGYNSRATGSMAIALGSEAKATGQNSVALGQRSEASEWAVVSVGNASLKRRIINVADGRLADGSSEAVTGNQLYKVKTSSDAAERIANAARTAASTAQSDATAALAKANANSRRMDAQSISLGAGAQASSDSAVAVGASTTAGNRSVAMGHEAKAAGSDAVAMGKLSYASGSYGTAVGHRSQALQESASAVGDLAMAGGARSSAIGYAANAAAYGAVSLGASSAATHGGSVALGSGSVTTSANQVSIGNAGTSLRRKIVNMADGSMTENSMEAVTGGQLFDTDLTAKNAKVMAEAAVAQSTAAAEGTKALSRLISNGTKLGTEGDAKASGTGALAVGIYTQAVGTAATAVGRTALALADGAIAIGDRVKIEDVASTHSIAIGSFSHAGAQKDLVAIGQSARATGAEGSMALGAKASASHSGSVALGYGSQTTGNSQVSVGTTTSKRRIVNVANATLSSDSSDAVTGAQLFATNGVARDADAAAKGAATTAGTALSKATALEGLIQTLPSGVVRLGAENDGTIVNVTNKSNKQRKITGIAAATLSAQSGEAVVGSQLYGTNLRVDALEGLVRQDAPAGGVRLGGNNTGSVLDVRNKSDGRRKISGVAEGSLVAGSADAVTGGQLAATNASVAGAEKLIADVEARLEAGSRRIAVGGPVDDEKAQAGRLGIAIGDSAFAAPTKDAAVALGSYSRAEAEDSVALGRAAWVQESASLGFALGSRSVVEEEGGLALGASSSVNKGARNGVAIGYGSMAAESNTASFGDGILQRRLTNLARGTADHNATTVGQLNDTLAKLGGGAKLDAAGNVTAPTYTVQNTRQHTVGDALTILDGAVVRTSSRVDRVEGQLRSVFLDTPAARADGLNQITLAGANGMILSNVGNGLIAAGSRDAVNGGQLHSMQQQLNGRMDGLEQRIDGQPQSRMMALASDDAGTPPSTPVVEKPTSPASKDDKVVASTGNTPKSSPQPKAEAPESPKPQVDTAELEKMLARANDYSDGIAREVDARLNKMDKRFNRMAAMSSAQTAMAMNTAGLATYNRLGAGVGYAEGESAMAVGYQRVLNEKGSATFSLNGAFTNSGERSMGMGVGIGW